jgi:hypothetical protein
VLERGTRGYWFKVKLEDGTTGWIFGELVFPSGVDEDRPGLFVRMGRRSAASAVAGLQRRRLSFSAGASREVFCSARRGCSRRHLA